MSLFVFVLVGMCGDYISAQNLLNGGSVSGSISPIGDQDTYTFSVNAGENFQIRLVDTNTTSLYPSMDLYDPNGAYVTSKGNNDVAAMSQTAASSGVYTLVVRDGSAQSNNTGDYSVHFVRLPGANENGSLLNGGQLSGSITLGDLDTYTFAVNAGENFQIRLVDTNTTALYPSMDLYDPNGAYVTSKGNDDVAAMSQTAGSSGVYTLVVRDGSTHSNNTGDYDVHFVRLPGANENGTLLNGGQLSESITLGDLDTYTFAVNAGENFQIRLVDTNTTALYPSMDLYDPNGAYVTSKGNDDVAAMSQTAASSGVYTLVVRDGSTHSNNTGDYDVHFVRLPGANENGTLLNGGQVSESITLGDLDTYTFAVNAGENFQIRLVDTNTTALYPSMDLYDPNGAYVTSKGNYDVAAMSQTAAKAGVYTLVVRDGSTHSNNTGDYDVHFVRLPGANEGGLLFDGISVSDLIGLGDLDSFTFFANAGELANVTVTDTAAGALFPRVYLYDTTGRFITSVGASTAATLMHAVTETGLYSIIVTDGSTQSTQTGPYSIVVEGAGIIPTAIPNVICPPQLPTDPILADVAGSPGFGPKIGDAIERFNVSIDCTGASNPSFFALQMWTGKRMSPMALTSGFLHVKGAQILMKLGFHSQSVETWFPIGSGIIVPNDPSLIGFPYTVQGYCDGYGSGGRLSSAITQTIED